MSSSAPSRTGAGDREHAASEAPSCDERKRFGCFGPGDSQLLDELRPMLAEHADAIVDAFYAHLQATPALRGHLADPTTVARLKTAQKGYLLSLIAALAWCRADQCRDPGRG